MGPFKVIDEIVPCPDEVTLDTLDGQVTDVEFPDPLGSEVTLDSVE